MERVKYSFLFLRFNMHKLFVEPTNNKNTYIHSHPCKHKTTNNNNNGRIGTCISCSCSLTFFLIYCGTPYCLLVGGYSPLKIWESEKIKTQHT